MAGQGMVENPAAGEDVAVALKQGYGLLRAGQYAEAAKFASDAIAVHGPDARLYDMAAEAELARGDPSSALEYIAQAAEHAPGPVPLLLKQADLLVRLRRRSEALRVADRIEALAGNDGQAWRRLAALRADSQDVVGAERSYRRAHELLGDQPSLLYDMSTMQFFKGDFEQAEVTLDRLLSLVPNAGDAYYLRATLRRQDAQRHHVEQLRAALASGFDSPASKAACLYALAKELEDLGLHEESFQALSEGARQKRSSLNYDVEAECMDIAALRQAYTAEALSSLPPGEGGEGAIFIVGLPRTGTTLLERLLVERGGARPAGELMDFSSLLSQATAQRRRHHPDWPPARASLAIDFAELGREYLRGAREAAGGSAVFIDKMPVNYLYCGMIATALPQARILHLVRDPLDACYAIYKTLFYRSYSFSYDLTELAEYYLAYRQTMAHWHAVVPGRILDVHYEQLATDPDATMERVLAWCGLDGPGASAGLDGVAFATASAAQVRGAIHTRSIKGSRRHWAGLTPLIRRLSEGGVRL